MNPEILVCVSQQANDVPYQFKVTGVHVFTFEEALYHTYHFWKQSVDDFLSDEMIAWVNDTLSLSYLAARMKEIARTDRFSKRLLAFLGIVTYFNRDELEHLRVELESWEKRQDWEKLKERADYLVRKGNPDKAVVLYRRALLYDENAALLNNMGVALMQMEAYAEAVRYLSRALALDDSNIVLVLHYAEAALYGGLFDDASKALQLATALDTSQDKALTRCDVSFLNGEMAFMKGDYAGSITCFQQAIDGGLPSPPVPLYVFRLSDVYMKLRQYDRALAVLEQLPDKDVDSLMKQAALYADANNVPAAIKSVQRALSLESANADIWAKYAMYHRMDYDLSAANAAITKALSLDGDNERAKLENARIKKGMGRIKEYQAVLNDVLAGFKNRYRELNGL